MAGPAAAAGGTERDADRLREVVFALADELRAVVLPELGSHAGRAHGVGGAGGDVTFAIDARAEAQLAAFLGEHAPGLAFYSEDRGLVLPGEGKPGLGDGPGDGHVLVVDPIDGTRPAMAGFEAACVSIAAAPLGEGTPRMGDVTLGVVLEIKSGTRFVAERGAGVEADVTVRPSAATDLGRLFWTFGFRGRPARATTEVLGELIDASSVGGGVFDLGSATYEMTRVVTGQVDAYVEPGPRLVAEVEGVRAEFERVGGGEILNNSPYDLAAAALCVTEAGAIVTDATGRALDDRPLLGSGHEFQMSVIACGSRELHAKLVAEVDRGIARLCAARACIVRAPSE